MNILTDGENTIVLFELLKRQTPERIFSDEYHQVVFDYGDFHIAAFPEDFVAASQNKSDEMINAKFEGVDSIFQPNENDKLLFQGKAVSRLWILRTLLYFTDHVLFHSEEEALGDFEINSTTDKAIADIMRKTTGGHDEVVCHPKSAEAESVNKEFANLVDAGVMLEIADKLLMCFAWNNGFQVVGRIMSLDDLKEEVAPFYEFVELWSRAQQVIGRKGETAIFLTSCPLNFTLSLTVSPHVNSAVKAKLRNCPLNQIINAKACAN